MNQDFDKQEVLSRLVKISDKLKIAEKKEEIAKLEQQSYDPQFWTDHQKANEAMKRLSDLQEEASEIDKIKAQLEQEEFSDEKKKSILSQVKALENKTFLSGPYDQQDVILSIHAGQGGTEACDWTQMLYRM